MNPSEGSAGVVSTFAIETAPVSSSISIASVKVPPMSTATRTLMRSAPPSAASSSRRSAIATRYTSRARSALTLPSSTSRSTRSGSRSSGGP